MTLTLTCNVLKERHLTLKNWCWNNNSQEISPNLIRQIWMKPNQQMNLRLTTAICKWDLTLFHSIYFFVSLNHCLYEVCVLSIWSQFPQQGVNGESIKYANQDGGTWVVKMCGREDIVLLSPEIYQFRLCQI